jgi:excisionase family DNA binding protein
MEFNSDTLTVPEVAQVLRVSRQTIYNMIRTGKLPHFRVGTKVRFNRTDIEAMMKTTSKTTGESK